jgi:hypothetical protein
MEEQIEGEFDVAQPPMEGGPWWVGRGKHTGHIVVDGEAICGNDVEIRHSHACKPLNEADLRGPKLIGECGRCHLVAESRGWLDE